MVQCGYGGSSAFAEDDGFPGVIPTRRVLLQDTPFGKDTFQKTALQLVTIQWAIDAHGSNAASWTWNSVIPYAAFHSGAKVVAAVQSLAGR